MKFCQVLPLRVKEELRVIVMNGYSTFSKTLELWPGYFVVHCYIQNTCWAGSYLPAAKQLVYSKVPADLAMNR